MTTLLALSAFAFTGCDLDDVTGAAFTETGGEYVVTDQHENTLKFNRDQAEQIADLGQEEAQAFLHARFRSKFPLSYSDQGSTFAISNQMTVPVDVQIAQTAKIAANLPGLVAPGSGTVVSVALNGLLGLGLLGYRHFKLKQLSRKDAALDGAGRLIDGVYNIAEVLPDKAQGKRIVKAVDQGLELVSQVAGAAEELKQAIKRTETASVDSSVYE